MDLYIINFLNFKQMFSNRFVKLILGFLILIAGLDSLFNIYSNRKDIVGKFSNKVNPKYNKNYSKEDEYWAKKIIEGGYILFFRHAEREKWIDVKMYDALESDLHKNGVNGTRYAENDYFSLAVCLNSRGLVQAKAMKEVIDYSKLPVGRIISSPSCRSRQTAEIVFGRYDSLDRNLVHSGPYNEDRKIKQNYLKNFLLNTPVQKGLNTVISAHNGVMDNTILSVGGDKLSLEEGGFYVISNNNNRLELKHEFHNFNDFSRVFFIRNFD